jgi:chromate reductase, NAD(P)H dehydrogenase (quinone)
VAPEGVGVERYDGLASLPAFNPDLDPIDGVGLPAVVAELRAAIGRADGLLLSAPEYAHGMAGAFKNLLDWLVGSAELHGKPAAVLTASARALHAPAQLREVLATMNVGLVDAACVTIPVPHGLDAARIAAHAELAPRLRAAVAALVRSLAPTA